MIKILSLEFYRIFNASRYQNSQLNILQSSSHQIFEIPNIKFSNFRIFQLLKFKITVFFISDTKYPRKTLATSRNNKTQTSVALETRGEAAKSRLVASVFPRISPQRRSRRTQYVRWNILEIRARLEWRK